MRLGLLGVVLDGVVEVLELLVADAAQRLDEVAQLPTDLVALGLPGGEHLEQGADLLVVVGADLGLDGLGAGHGGLAAQHGRAPAQARRQHAPHGVHGRRPDTVPRDHGVERRQVARLLLVHVRHQRPQVRVRVDDRRRLPLVDERGRQLAGLIYPELRGGDQYNSDHSVSAETGTSTYSRGEKVSLFLGQGLHLGLLSTRGRGSVLAGRAPPG